MKDKFSSMPQILSPYSRQIILLISLMYTRHVENYIFLDRLKPFFYDFATDFVPAPVKQVEIDVCKNF